MILIHAAVPPAWGLRGRHTGALILAFKVKACVSRFFPAGVGPPRSAADGWETARRPDRPPLLEVRSWRPRLTAL